MKMYKIKRMIFIVKWHWKNRNWCECRHKRRSLDRALKKEEYRTIY